MSKNIFFCSECMSEHSYKEIIINEEVTIKDKSFFNQHVYLECTNCKEQFESIENPDQNYLSDYRRYRDLKGWLQPEEIAKVRDKYGLSLRKFADLLGISYASLSRFENGALQSDHHNVLFLLANNTEAFKSLVEAKKNAEILNQIEYVSLIKKLNKMILKQSIPTLEPTSHILDKVMYEKMYALWSKNHNYNPLRSTSYYNIGLSVRDTSNSKLTNKLIKRSEPKGGKPVWTKEISHTLIRN